MLYACQSVPEKAVPYSSPTIGVTSSATDIPVTVPPATETATPLATATATQVITITPVLTETALLTDTQSCASFRWIEDVTVPDGTVMMPGEIFLKIWRIENTGTCAWNLLYEIAYDHGDYLGGPEKTLARFYPAGTPLELSLGNSAWSMLKTEVAPGEQVDIPLVLRSPDVSGHYQSVFRLGNEAGIGIDFLWVEIVVEGDLANTNTWSGEWIHSDPSSIFDEETPLVLQQDGDAIKGYFYSSDGRLMLINGQIEGNGNRVTGRWGAIDQGGGRFTWQRWGNHQFRGVYQLGSFDEGDWCGSRDDLPLPEPCGLNP